MPKKLENIVGQEHVVKLLNTQLEAEQTSHAYLFAGPVGSGRLECAKAMAAALLGDEFADKIANDTCVDVKIYEPQGVQTYLAGQIKEIVKDSNLAPIQAKQKVYIIREAEKLGTSAANAFLKTLEEPSTEVCFILLANNAENVLPTITSRCQLINFKQIPKEMAILHIQQEGGCARDDAENALKLFGGDTEHAIEFCLDQNLQDLYHEAVDVVKNADIMSDWEVLQRSKDIVSKISEVVEVHKKNLEDKTKELTEVLDPHAISIINDQNKRSVSAKQFELLHLFCASIKFYFRNLLLNNNSSEKYIAKLERVNEIEQNLAYNIAPQNFCDVCLLELKRI